MNSLKDLFLPLAALALLCCFLPSCSSGEKNRGRMQRAEQMMESAPESALKTLDSIHLGALSSKKDKARYALLRSMALDKNAIDTISFEVIQPAVDYYLHQGKGSPDDRLRTLYYQGRIFQNRKEDEDAMRCFIKATDMKEKVTDSLRLAQANIARCILYFDQNRFESYVDYSLAGANIYKKLGRVDYYRAYLKNAIEGVVQLKDKERADSLINQLKRSGDQNTYEKSAYSHWLVSYAITFLDKKSIKKILDDIDPAKTTDGERLIMARGYVKAGDREDALRCFESVSYPYEADPMQYQAIKADVLEENGDYKGALSALRDGIELSDSIVGQWTSDDRLFIEKKYALEKEIFLEEQQSRKTLTWFICVGVVLLFMGMTGWILYRGMRLKKVEAENEALHALTESRELKKQIDSLLVQTDRSRDVETELKSLIKERVKIIYGLLASELANGSSKRPRAKYDRLLKQAQEEQEVFLKDLVDIYELLYPEFMHALRDRGLTEKEIIYCLLYSIGFNGKQMGVYMNTKDHYNITSRIRKKLELEKDKHNLTTYLKDMID